jgi:multiple sugar transport system permease protein
MKAQLSSPPPRLRQNKRRLSRVALYALIVAVVALVAFPIYWMVLSTFQPVRYALTFPPALWFKGLDGTEFHTMFSTYAIGRWIWNSIQLALMATAVCLVLSALGAYTLSHLRWKGKPAFGFLLLLTQMMPGAIIIVPVSRQFRDFQLYNSLPALALLQAAFALPICCWILKNVFDSIPREVVESALVEGCGPLGVLWRILVPLSIPGLVAVGVVAFFFSWNEFLFANTMINNQDMLPASVGLATMISELDTPFQQLLAGGLVFSILPVVFYIAVQRYIISGLTAGAIKG